MDVLHRSRSPDRLLMSRLASPAFETVRSAWLIADTFSSDACSITLGMLRQSTASSEAAVNQLQKVVRVCPATCCTILYYMFHTGTS